MASNPRHTHGLVRLRHLACLAALVGLSVVPARADGSQCNAPPYGGSLGEYVAFVKNFGPYLEVTSKHVFDSTDVYLNKVCRAKFGGFDRQGMYNVGINDNDIDTQSTASLGVKMMIATKKFLDRHPLP